MKTGIYSYLKKTSLAFCLGMILHFTSSCQCNNNLSTRFYDTVLTGIGYGTYQISFPSWNPDSGLLVSATVKALVSLKYGFSVKNVDTGPATYSIWVGREDQITSPVLTAPYDKIIEQKIGAYPLNPGIGFVQAPFDFLDHQPNTDSITGNVAAFMGAGKVNFTYAPITYTNIRTTNNMSYNFSSASRDTVHFSLTYLYCKGGGVLATSLSRFTAVLQEGWGAGTRRTIDGAKVQLAWTVENERPQRRYEIEISRNGKDFRSVAALHSIIGPQAEYTYGYDLTGEPPGRFYFRLKMTDVNGVVSFSGVREVSAGVEVPEGNSGGISFSLFPNPAVDHINLFLGRGAGTDWQVDVIASNGSLVQRTEYRLSLMGNRQAGAGVISIDFQRLLPAGTYFIRATDRKERQTYSTSFLIVNRN
ncbi:hypothetical protein ACX0G9_22340 [Flavitalea flava]